MYVNESCLVRRSWMRYNFITERYTKDEIDKIIAKGDKRYMTEETRMILERLDSMGQDLKETKVIAMEARDAANEAKEIAMEARDAANEAKEIAVEARDAANEAKEIAMEARDAANEAKEIAMEARDAANEAKEIAMEARDAANEAKVIAMEARDAANEAKEIAMEARDAANEAKKIATEARDAANEAKIISKEALFVAMESKKSVEDLHKKVIRIQTTIEQEVCKKIDIIGEGHDFLKMSLDRALKMEQERERMWLEIFSLRMDMKDVKNRLCIA